MKILNNTYKAVIFDMDGVISNTNPYHKKAWLKFAEKYNLEITDYDLKNNMYGRTNNEIFKFLFKKGLLAGDIKVLSGEKEKIFREIYKDNAKPLKGLINFLNELKNSGIKIGLATSAPKDNVNFILNKLNIRSFFDLVIDPSGVLKSKPDPEIYLKSAELLKVKPQECIVFEDSIPGVEAGKAAGMKVIGVTSTHSKQELNCKFTINDFDELLINIQKVN